MGDAGFACQYDAGTSTLVLRGTIDQASWPRFEQEVDRAYRRTACVLTIDLRHADLVPRQLLGRLVHLCNLRYRGTLVRPPSREHLAATA